MLSFKPDQVAVTDQPFPHAVIDNLLPPELFTELQASYPECPPASGPTGHTIHRGDVGFDAQMEAYPLWQKLFSECNSPGFVDSLVALFADEIARSCTVERNALRFADHIESRAEKETGRIANPVLPAQDMFVRFDFMQGMKSYNRGAHLDHRRRLATMLIYFDAPGPETFEGGDLILHDAAGQPVQRIAPAKNRAVLFACSERSWHSVDEVTVCHHPRRFVQVAVSSCHDIWPTTQLPASGKLEWAHRMLRKLVPARAG